ncbi:unnamed protein product [Chilo suppressalis]|uniref:TNFR-Cys domain-containing protein n=1 Tax=Chilo suppressalis TaxID=168631 RepID=A0ABN8APL9_CHISP|nr:unnamed protein product [Chilo suppressalis]
MTSGQPQCIDDSQCSSGFFCEEILHTCQECVRCGDLQRETLVPPDYCVKSVLDCGGCLKGFVEDLRIDHACIPFSERAKGTSGGSLLPTYAWVLIVLSLLVVLTIISIYIFKKETLFSYICKIRTSTHASVQSRCNYNGVVAAPATAPPAQEPPPAYDLYYPSERPVSPSDAGDHNTLPEESSDPFIKRMPATPAHWARLSADNQAAIPFNNPSYIRGPAPGLGGVEESGPVSPFQPHDEDTMESLWTPNESVNNGYVVEVPSSPSTGAEAAGGVASSVRSVADSGPPAKVARLGEESNNNRGRESGNSGAGSLHSPSPTSSSAPQRFIFNLNVTNVANVLNNATASTKTLN